MIPKSNPSKERAIGKKYATKLQTSIRTKISSETVSRTGLMLATTVKPIVKKGLLDRLVITSPHYAFKQHYGFEGVRKNGRKLSLKSTNHLQSLTDVSILSGLADEISNQRADLVTASINFN